MRPEELLSAMTAAEREAAELMREAHDILAECKTGHRDVVTAYDRKVQELLIARLSEAVPGARFFCEENDRHDELSAGHVFIIVPIDGTMNFVRGLHHSCVSVACCRSGVLSAAAIYNPYAEEMFTAVRGEGAFCNGKAIRVTADPFCETVTACGTSPYNPELTDRTFALMRMAFLESLDIRREGSAALDLCSAAAGRVGVYVEPSISLWDYAAGKLIVEEAGGVCRTLEGRELPFDGRKTSVVAGSPENVAEFLRLAAKL